MGVCCEYTVNKSTECDWFVLQSYRYGRSHRRCRSTGSWTRYHGDSSDSHWTSDWRYRTHLHGRLAIV